MKSRPGGGGTPQKTHPGGRGLPGGKEFALQLAGPPYFSAVTVLEVIQRSAEFLARKDVETPRLQVELLLAHVLRLPRMGLYLNFSRELTPPELDQVRELVRRRGTREPLQVIVGSTSFCGYEMMVNGRVLVPRPETELLAECGWTHLNQSGLAAPAVLDFGTGSGCLAITLALKCSAARVTALDISPEALAVARQNCTRHGVAERVQFHEGDGFAALPPGAEFDLLVANPPYIPTAEIATLEPEVREHDPRLALDGGADGLDFYRRLAAEAGAYLRPGSLALCEFGDGQGPAVSAIFATQMWIVERVQADYSGRDRFVVLRRGAGPRVA